jgi:hypothetical protein
MASISGLVGAAFLETAALCWHSDRRDIWRSRRRRRQRIKWSQKITKLQVNSRIVGRPTKGVSMTSAVAIGISRILVLLLGLAVWTLFYFDARLAYRMPRGARRYGCQLAAVLGAVAVVLLQIQVMLRLAPSDIHGDFFRGFVLIEGSGALVTLFATLFRERARSMKLTRTSDSAEPRRWH